MTRIMVGCPVHYRGWILDEWYEHLMNAADGFEVEFAFVASCGDQDSFDRIKQWAPAPAMFWVTDEPRIAQRAWGASRYEHMVYLRNKLLGLVRAAAPPLFLSLDSDILLHPGALPGMVDTLETFANNDCWAVGGKTWMTPTGVTCPSYGFWSDPYQRQLGIKRFDAEDQRLVDVLMGIKLMTPQAYNVDYSTHSWGEDLGWSANVQDAGGKMWWDGRYASKHIMSPEMLDREDERFDW